MGPGASGGGKDLGGFMKSFAGNLGGQMSGLGQVGGPMSGLGVMKQLMGGEGGGDSPEAEDNPGAKMFGQAGGNSNAGFLERFKDQLFRGAMTNFMGGNG